MEMANVIKAGRSEEVGLKKSKVFEVPRSIFKDKERNEV